VPTERKWWEKLLKLHKDKQLPEGFEDFEPETVKFAGEPDQTPAPQPPPLKGGGTEDQARFSAIETENAGLRAAALQTAGEKFYSVALEAGKALPAEKDSLVAMFKQAAQDDNQGKACFSASGELLEGERVKALRAMIEARPAHSLTSEELKALKSEDLVILSGGGGPATKMTGERRQELLAAGDIKVPAEGGK
jgi:hypothetical protein